MPDSPKENEEKMLKVLNAWKTLAPAKSFAGISLEDFELQINKSLARRRRLNTFEGEKMQQMSLREPEDTTTTNSILSIVAGVIADPTECADSALCEGIGYICKDACKSGLTRKKVQPATTV